MKRIELPIYGIVVELDEDRSGTITTTDLKTENNDEEDELYNAAMDGLESLILACACSGVDIESAQFIEAIKTSVDAISQNF